MIRRIWTLKTNVFRQLNASGCDRTVVLYDTTDPYAVISWLARALSVNFSANNAALTMKFKHLPGVAADQLTQTQVAQCLRLGINYYAYVDDVAMVAEGTCLGGRFFDEVHLLDWLVDAVQKEVFAVLHRSPTKVPLTDAGTHLLIAACKKSAKKGSVTAPLPLASGTGRPSVRWPPAITWTLVFMSGPIQWTPYRPLIAKHAGHRPSRSP